MNRTKFLYGSALLAGAACAKQASGGIIPVTSLPFAPSLPHAMGFGPDGKKYGPWHIDNFIVSITPGEPKFHTPPVMYINDTNVPGSASVGMFVPIDDHTLHFQFQDPDYFDGRLVQTTLSYGRKGWLKHRELTWFEHFMWEINGKDYPGGPGGILHRYGTPKLGLNFVNGSVWRTLYPSGQQQDLGVGWPFHHGKGPDMTKKCGEALTAYWLACGAVIVAALQLLETRGSPAAQAQAALAAAALITAWWFELVECD